MEDMEKVIMLTKGIVKAAYVTLAWAVVDLLTIKTIGRAVIFFSLFIFYNAIQHKFWWMYFVALFALLFGSYLITHKTWTHDDY